MHIDHCCFGHPLCFPKSPSDFVLFRPQEATKVPTGCRQGESCNHRCPFWLVCSKNRGPWFRWGFISFTGEPIYFSRRPPMLAIRFDLFLSGSASDSATLGFVAWWAGSASSSLLLTPSQPAARPHDGKMESVKGKVCQSELMWVWVKISHQELDRWIFSMFFQTHSHVKKSGHKADFAAL